MNNGFVVVGEEFIVGKWLCFVVNDWEDGLLYLVKGDDELFKIVV